MKKMLLPIFGFCLIWPALPLRAEESAPATPEVTIQVTPAPAPKPSFNLKGFVKAWAQVSEDPSDKGLDQGTLMLKSSRLIVQGQASDEVSVQLVSELAGGIKVLDAYASWKASPHYTLVGGQFKFPFGKDRMETPASLERVDYSGVTARITNRVAVNGWDDGFMAKAQWGPVKFDAAIFQGQGPNQATPSARDEREYSATLEWVALPGLKLGGSFYDGQDLAFTNRPDFVTAAYLVGQVGAADLSVEYLAQHWGKYGVISQLGYKIADKYKVFVYYDRVEDPRDLPGAGLGHSGGRSEQGLGLICDHVKGLRLTLQVSGANAGPDQTPRSTQAVAQALARF